MRFVEETEGTWTAVQLKAVEMEIEQQKREWEANRLAALKKEEEERQRLELEENESMISYAREDALNKVNNTNSNSKKSLVSTRNSSKSSRKSKSNSPKSQAAMARNNGLMTRKSQQGVVVDSNGSKGVNRKMRDVRILTKSEIVRQTRRNVERRRAKSTRSNSSSVHSRATTTERATSHSHNGDGSDDSEDSECSMDVMIDSNDVNDSDSNSNHNGGKHGETRHVSNSNFDSSQDEETLMNDDTPTVVNKLLNNTIQSDATSSPRTRSRGSVKIDLWTLDDSPILPPFKRSKVVQNRSGNDSTGKSDLESSQEGQSEDLKVDFGIKELKVVIDDVSHSSASSPNIKCGLVGASNKSKASPRNTRKRGLNVSAPASNNHTLDNWLQKIPKTAASSPNPVPRDPLKPESPTRIMTRRSTMREH